MTEPIKGREPFSMLIHAIERDLERTPDGNGGEIYYFPATEKDGSMGHNGEYLLKEWQEVTADLAASIQMHEEARALAVKYWEAIQAAPHADLCKAANGWPGGECDCWKSELV